MFKRGRRFSSASQSTNWSTLENLDIAVKVQLRLCSHGRQCIELTGNLGSFSICQAAVDESTGMQPMPSNVHSGSCTRMLYASSVLSTLAAV